MLDDVQLDVVANALEARLMAAEPRPTPRARGVAKQARQSLRVARTPRAKPEKPEESSICVRAKQIELQQWDFVVIYQVLILILAAATVALLTWLIFQLAKSGSTSAETATAKALGALVTGVASRWVAAQRKDARLQHDAAIKLQEKHKCP